jgi:hypothetical protein
MAVKEGALDGVEGVNLAQGRNRWWALVNGIINLRVLEKVENVSTSWETISSPIKVFYPCS